MPVYAYVCLAVLALSYLVRHKAKLLTVFAEELRFKGDCALSLAQRWAIAAGADLAARNHQ